MGWVFGTLAATMGAVFLWGVLAPRSQWYALSSWSVSDPHINEPGGAAYFVRRLLSALGLLALVAVLVLTNASVQGILSPLRSAPPVGDIEVMWGTPQPHYVERVTNPVAASSPGLVPMPLRAYQAFEDGQDKPGYFMQLDRFTMLGNPEPAGLLGTRPAAGYSAISFADLVVQVRGPLLCIPREVVVVETADTVTVGVSYGRPDPTPVRDGGGNEVPGPAPDHVSGCPTDDHVTASVLIPVSLTAPVGERTVLTLDGKELREIPVS